MRQGFSRELEALVRCADPIAEEKIFAEVELRADYIRRKDVFDDGTVVPASGIRFLDDGIRLDDTLSTKIQNVSVAGPNITDLDRDSPVTYAVVRWAGGDPAELEIHNIRCRLDPGGGGNDVVTWRMILYAVVRREESYLGATPAIWIMPIAVADVANGGATLPGDFTFGFTDTLPRPLRRLPTDFDDTGVDSTIVPTTWIQVLALKADGTPATNGAWVAGGGDVTTGGNVLTCRSAQQIEGDLGGVWQYTATPVTPNLTIRMSGYVNATIEFDGGNRLDLGAVPTQTVRFETLERVPFGTSVVYEVRNDANTAWVVFKDGDTTDDLTGVGKNQFYRIRIGLNTNGAANLSPQVVAVGVKELTEVDLSDVAELSQQSVAVDPITLTGSIAEATLTAIRDGEIDFQDRITTLLAGNQFGKIQIRRFIAADGLARDKWLHMDDWLLEDYELAGPRIVLSLVSVTALLKRALPPFDTATDTRDKVQFSGTTLKAAWESLLQNELLVPDRRFGPGIEDAVTTVSTEITDSDGKTEANALTRLAGAAVIASQGAIKVVDMLGEKKEVVQAFVFEELAELSVTPGFRARVPVFFVPFEFDFEKNRFKKEIRRFHGNALLNLDIPPVDGVDTLENAPAKWIDVQALAEKVAQRTVDTLGTGMILFRVRSSYAYPELEPGDMVTIETDRFVARDPNLTTRGLKGSLFVRGVIQEISDPWGREFVVWVRSYADILSAAETVTLGGFAVPTIVRFSIQIDADTGTTRPVIQVNDALSVRVASSLSAFPSRATTQAAAVQTLDADGSLVGANLLALTAPGTIFVTALAYEKTTGDGEESEILYKTQRRRLKLERKFPFDDDDFALRSPSNTGRQIENITRIVDGSGNFVPNRHTESGLNKDGDAVTFALAFEGPPSMWFVQQVGLSYRSADTAVNQVLDMAAESLTVTGYNLRAKIISGATATAIVDGFSAAQNTGDPENGTVTLTAEGAVAFSNLEDANTSPTTYDVFFDVDATGIGDNLVTVEIYTNDGASSTTWTLRASRTYDNATNLTDEKLSFTIALGVNFDLRLRITYASAPGGSTATITALGEDSTPEEGVQYDKVTGGTALSMTPNTGDKVRWTAQEASA